MGSQRLKCFWTFMTSRPIMDVWVWGAPSRRWAVPALQQLLPEVRKHLKRGKKHFNALNINSKNS